MDVPRRRRRGEGGGKAATNKKRMRAAHEETQAPPASQPRPADITALQRSQENRQRFTPPPGGKEAGRNHTLKATTIKRSTVAMVIPTSKASVAALQLLPVYG